MTYLAITQRIATWLNGKPGLLDTLYRSLREISGDGGLRGGSELVEGSIRLAKSRDSKLVSLWDSDYLTGTGDESWGFIKLTGELGILEGHSVARVVLERCIYVVGQRLQGLTIDGAIWPRAYDNGVHTCLAGRGAEARQLSIAYVERHVGSDQLPQHSLLCVGPLHDFGLLVQGAEREGAHLKSLVNAANSSINTDRKVELTSADSLKDLREFIRIYTNSGVSTDEYKRVEVAVSSADIDITSKHNAIGLSYLDWIGKEGPLSKVQRRILESDAVEEHPLRIIGPAGSGKTLLMQLLALRRFQRAKESGASIRVLFVVHNSAMAQSVRQRFEILQSSGQIATGTGSLRVATLSELARELLQLEAQSTIDADANESKNFQLGAVRRALKDEMDTDESASSSALFSAARKDAAVFHVLSVLIVSEISIAIKGHGLEKDKKRYVESAKSLSRFHGILSPQERAFVFSVFERYHHEVFEYLEVLDSDDLAISLLGRLRTPIWELRRKQIGYDYVFVDETQLFNENERRIFALLTTGLRNYVPIVLALDEAQAVFGQTSAGFAALGIEGISSENLPSIHRSTKAIVDLAFFVIQRSADLFGPDFPDFTKIADRIESDAHHLAARPRVDQVPVGQESIGRFIRKRISELRKANLRQIGIIVHSDRLWDPVFAELSASELPVQTILTRGERVPPDQPLVALTKPAFVGGQEFDAVVLVGLEQGIVPPSNIDNEALSAAVEQQALREIYLAVTRARYRVVIVISASGSPTPVIAEAIKHGLVEHKSNAAELKGAQQKLI